jgi:hypothetical protein
MTSYRVSFYKNLLSSDGHPFKCLQHAIDVPDAPDADRAVKAAELQYQRLRGIPDWMLHADYFELEVDGEKVDYCPIGARASAAERTWAPATSIFDVRAGGPGAGLSAQSAKARPAAQQPNVKLSPGRRKSGRHRQAHRA